MKFANWFRRPHHILAIFLVIATVSAGALGWLMWLLLDQDKTVELQRSQERLEQAADRAGAAMQAALADLDRGISPGILVIHVRPDGLTVRPAGVLLYSPVVRRSNASSRFNGGELLEFARNDLKAAAVTYRTLVFDKDRQTRAGALMRLARVQRKLKEYDAAIASYGELSQLTDTPASGLPAGLVAREGRAAVFQQTKRVAELRKEAVDFEKDLSEGVWQLNKSEYAFYRAEMSSWAGDVATTASPDAVAWAEAVAFLWENRANIGHDFRRVIPSNSGTSLVVARPAADGFAASIAGPTYLASLCREVVPDPALRCTLTDSEGGTIVGETVPARMVATRTASAAKLPWNLQVFSTKPMAGSSSPRRTLLFWVAAVLGFIWLSGAAFIVLAIEKEMRVAQLQSDFVSAVSHEFRSPLSSLCQISEMLCANRFESEGLRRNAYGVLARESERLRGLVEALLDFQRFEAGAAVYHFERIDLGDLLRSLVADFQARIAAAGYTVELNGADGPAFVRADREALSRALWNLLDNAAKYSPDNRTISVELASDSERISVAVQDHGIGIPVREQKEIFQKFVRGSESTSRRIKGTGLGLAMVRHIIEAHRGEILLSSEPGAGSRFTIVIPGAVSR